MQACVQQVHWLRKLKTKHLFLPLFFFLSKQADVHCDMSDYIQIFYLKV